LSWQQNNEEILKLAREAGFDVHPIWIDSSPKIIVRHSSGTWVTINDSLSKFADLVCEKNTPVWRKTSEEIPEDGQFVNFVVYYPPYADGTPRRQGYLHGKVFGGEFSKAMHEAMGGGFSTPGQGYFANYWMPVPEFKEDK